MVGYLPTHNTFLVLSSAYLMAQGSQVEENIRMDHAGQSRRVLSAVFATPTWTARQRLSAVCINWFSRHGLQNTRRDLERKSDHIVPFFVRRWGVTQGW